MLTQRDAGGEQGRVGRRCAILLWAACGPNHDLLELPVNLSDGKGFIRQDAVPSVDPVVGGDSGDELRCDVTLSALGHYHACGAEFCYF